MEITLGSLLRQDMIQAFSYLAYSIPVAALTAFLSWLYVRKSRKKGDRLHIREALSAIFVAYLAVVLSLTLLNREAGSRQDVSLELFGTFHPDVYSMSYVVENFFMLMPFGAFLPILFDFFGKVRRCALAAFLFSFLIETVQYATERGYFQLDDLVLNTLGAVVTAGVVIGCRKWFRRKNRAGRAGGSAGKGENYESSSDESQ